MTWTVDADTGEVTAPWGETVGSITPDNYALPDDVQEMAESLFREESMTSLSTDRIADYAEAWMGDVEVTYE